MSAQANYFRVGVFVLSAIALVVAAIIIFGSIQLFPGRKIKFETYVSDSVQGMSVGAKLRLKGVTIGEVEEVGFVASEYDLSGMADDDKVKYGRLVRVVASLVPEELDFFHKRSRAEIRKDLAFRVKSGLRLRVTSAGITGGRFLEAAYLEPERHPPLEVPWEPRHLYIPAAPGVFAEIVDSIDELTDKLGSLDLEAIGNDVRDMVATIKDGVDHFDFDSKSQKLDLILDDAHGVLGDDNIPAAVENLKAASDSARELIDRLDSNINDEKIEQLTGDVSDVIEQARVAIEELPSVIATLESVLERTDYLLATEDEDIEVTLRELRLTLENLRELSETVKRYPATLIFGGEPGPSKLGEKP